jgi:hypothetical protein
LYAYNNKLISLPESLTGMMNPYFDFYNNCIDTGTMSQELISSIDDRYNSSYGDWKLVQNACTVENFSCANVTDVPQAECQALVDIYNNTDGTHWNNKDRWFWFTDKVCNRNGITCSEDGHVNQINLQSNNLV